jgi:hypothetical protein
LQRVCEHEKIPWSPQHSAFIRERCKKGSQSTVLRACYPRDIVLILKNIAEYDERAPRLHPEDIDRAITLYFAR